MDNVTHTLIGVLVGEAVARVTKPSESSLTQEERRNLIVTTMAVGSNVPDLDFIYSTITGSKLDYLLQHRGHTHTFVVSLLIAALLVLACELWLKKRGRRPSTADRIAIAGTALLAPVVHILMDMTNNYGVHPWWPFDNRWMYGDSVFIIEPLLWAAATPLLFTLRTPVARGIVAFILLAGIALTFVTGMVPMPIAFAYVALVAGLLYIGWKMPARPALFSGIALWLLVTAGFVYAGHLVAKRVDALSAERFPQARLLDRVVTPMPINPICWEIMFVQQEAEYLVLRRAMFSLLPTWIAAQRCPGRGLDIPITAPLQPVASTDSPSVKWHGEIRSRTDELTALWRENCRVSALMRFARAPWLATIDQRLVLGDLRYDREAALGFAEIEVESAAEPCPVWVPPWVPPREDVVRGRRQPSRE